MADLITELRERRVLPAVGVYAAGCWVLIEILDRLVERYLLSPYLTDIVFWGLYSLIPAVVLVAWSYGRPGKDKATTAQKVGVPINIIATAGLLITLFGGKDLGVTADRVTLANEEGVEETHIVPKKTYRRRLAVFFYANESDDPSLDWLQYGATELLTQDLQQDPFMLATSPYGNWGGGYYGRMRGAGFEDGLGVPRSLLREIASDANRDFFTEGSINRSGDELVVSTRLWETVSMRQVADIVVTGWDIHAIFDEASIRVREAMEVPSVNLPGQEDMPLAETYGESDEALQTYIKALNTRLFTGDVPASIAQLDEVLEQDPNFVLAHFVKAMHLAESGNLPAAAAALQEAEKMDYRLPSRDRATMKAMYYRSSGQVDKLIDFLELQVSLRDDARTHAQLGEILLVAGDTEGAKASFITALERDANMMQLNLLLSTIERGEGDMDEAIRYAKAYQQARPQDMEAGLQLGDLLRDSGQLDEAEEHYVAAQMLESDTVEPILRQRIIAARRGDEARARALLEEAFNAAQTATQLATVHQSASYFEARLGRLRAAMEQLRAAEPYVRQAQPPFVVVLSSQIPIAGMKTMLGETKEARAAIDEAIALLQPPLDQFLAASEAQIYARQGAFDEAYAALQRFEDVLNQLKFEGLIFQVGMVRADIQARQGDHAGAAESLRTSIETADKSFLASQLHAHDISNMYAQLGQYQVWAGDLEGAEKSIETGFRLDPSLPQLWFARALLQNESGMTQLAQASINYALALWESADEEFEPYQLARALAGELGVAPQ